MCEWTCVRQMDGWMGVDGVQMDGKMVGQTDEQMRAWSPAGWIWMWVWVPDGLEVKDGMCGQLMEGDGSPRWVVETKTGMCACEKSKSRSK